jgi:hypothetical protein
MKCQKKLKSGKIPGTVEIRYKDEHGKTMFEWKRNRSGSNVEDGVYELFKFIKEKMSVDLISYMESLGEDINSKKNNKKNEIQREKR